MIFGPVIILVLGAKGFLSLLCMPCGDLSLNACCFLIILAHANLPNRKFNIDFGLTEYQNLVVYSIF